ncbi:MAG: hypothetical protein IJV69_02235 [Kiritimatiellae bacterium]|nr:hypothetical protein [Kiritimatiellia bacterium]
MLKHFLFGLALMGAASGFATEGISDVAAQLFGTEEASKRVSDGVVFIDGEYVRGPYSVTREGNVILVNGRIASRFKVEARAAAEAAARAAVTATDPGIGANGHEDRVSDDEGASLGSDDTPQLDDTPVKEATVKTSAIDAKLAKSGKGGSIDERLAAKQKAKNLKKESATGTFNQVADAGDPMALFEEADYTYTPPSKPEPKAVPYVRPAAQKPIAERMAEARKKDAETAKKAMATAADAETEAEEEVGEGEDLVAVEDFSELTEEEIDAYTKKFTERRAAIEKTLNADGMVLLSSASSGMKSVKRATMWRFVQQLEGLCGANNASKLQSKWGKELPRAYLQRIYDNRSENIKNMKTLILRVKREEKAAKQRQKNRI